MSTAEAFLCPMDGFQGDWLPEEIACSVLSKWNNHLAVRRLVPLSVPLEHLAVNIFHPVGTAYKSDVKDAESHTKISQCTIRYRKT